MKSNNNKFYIVSNSEGLRNRLYQGLWVASEAEIIPMVSDITTSTTIDNAEELAQKEKDLDTKKKIIESNPKKDETGTTSWKDIEPLD